MSDFEYNGVPMVGDDLDKDVIERLETIVDKDAEIERLNARLKVLQDYFGSAEMGFEACAALFGTVES